MGKRITIVIAAIVVLALAFLLVTTRRNQLHEPGATAPTVVP